MSLFCGTYIVFVLVAVSGIEPGRHKHVVFEGSRLVPLFPLLSVVIWHLHPLLILELGLFLALLVTLVFHAHEETSPIRIPEMVSGEDREMVRFVESEVFYEQAFQCLQRWLIRHLLHLLVGEIRPLLLFRAQTNAH